MITIIIPLYNKEMQISETLRSVTEQRFTRYEVVIVDDGSTDRSAEVVIRFLENSGRVVEQISPNQWITDDARFRLIRQPNAGVSVARNRGIEAAMFDYIAFLDADDRWKPGFLYETVALINRFKSECDVFASKYCFYTASGAVKEQILQKMPFSDEMGILSNYFEVAACSHPPLCSINTVVSRKAICRVGGFPEGITAGEDLLTWARLAANFRIAYSMNALSLFYLPEKPGFSPKRVPQNPDRVGDALRALSLECNSPGLKEYISRWHEMRASVFLRLGDNRQSVREIVNSCRFAPKPKLILYLLLLVCPLFLRLKLFALKSAQC